MERASRVQLQQYTNGAQPSVDRRVPGGPSGFNDSKRAQDAVDSRNHRPTQPRGPQETSERYRNYPDAV